MILMVSVTMKANIFALIYLIFILKYLASPGKTQLMVHMTVLVSFCFITQYMLFMLNMIHNTSPALYPKQFKGYPFNDKTGMF